MEADHNSHEVGGIAICISVGGKSELPSVESNANDILNAYGSSTIVRPNFNLKTSRDI